MTFRPILAYALSYALGRLSEASTYGGLAAMLALAGFHMSDPLAAGIAQTLAAGAGALAVFLRERGVIG